VILVQRPHKHLGSLTNWTERPLALLRVGRYSSLWIGSGGGTACNLGCSSYSGSAVCRVDSTRPTSFVDRLVRSSIRLSSFRSRDVRMLQKRMSQTINGFPD
jgi:hypothetical protein